MLATLLVVFVVFSAVISPALAQQPPTYKVDPFWPQELPDALIIGAAAGITVDHQDHIWCRLARAVAIAVGEPATNSVVGHPPHAQPW